MVYAAKKAMTIQYHPESSPGPHDADICFDDFINVSLACSFQADYRQLPCSYLAASRQLPGLFAFRLERAHTTQRAARQGFRCGCSPVASLLSLTSLSPLSSLSSLLH
jgi:hypothetical protein